MKFETSIKTVEQIVKENYEFIVPVYQRPFVWDDEEIKKLLFNNPPYALKLWNSWNTTFPDATTNECLESTGYFAIQISTRFVET